MPSRIQNQKNMKAANMADAIHLLDRKPKSFYLITSEIWCILKRKPILKPIHVS